MFSNKESKKKASDNIQDFIDALHSTAIVNCYLYGVDQAIHKLVMPTLVAHEIGQTSDINYKSHRQVCVSFIGQVYYLNAEAIKHLSTLAQEHDMCLSGIDFQNRSLYFLEGGC